jgi:predicted RNA binding protein with dsRBD fold (UPF0201 family)
MAEYYKYVDRDADSQINYAEVGQQAVGMLQNWNQTREEKKEAYNQASRESINNLMQAPQGKDQNANDFISKYVQKMINQKLVNKNLFERGEMSEQQYTLSMQNQMDGTKRLFNLQKLYQQEWLDTMQGIDDKKYQRALTISNQSDVEGAANFNQSEAFIDPIDGTVSVGLMENKVIDGKLVKVLNPNTTASTAVWTGKIMQKPAYFDVDTKTTDFVKGLGDLKDAMYSAASTTRAGTITELTGIEFLKTNIKDPATKAIIENFNKSLNYEAESYLSNPLNTADILGDKIGKYDYKSFTFDRELADKDPNKILKTIDPVTQMTTLDKTGKYYNQQYNEAKDFIKTQILVKLDNERKISTTGQLSESAYTRERAARINRDKPEDKTPVIAGEILNLTTTDSKGKKNIIGATQRIENVSFPAGKGIELVADQLSYNSKKGVLELSGKKISGKEQAGSKTPGKDGVLGSDVQTVVKEERFVKNNINSAPLLSTAVLQFPNPLDENGGNYTSVAQALEVLKKITKSRAGKSSTKSSGTIQFDDKGNIIEN